MDEFDNNEKLLNDQAIQLLVDLVYIEKGSAQHGVLKQYLGEGYGSLSEKQRYHFHESVEPLLNQTCAICGEQLSLDELTSELHESEKLCGRHRWQISKDD
ncbi:hypothetical protein [Vibrio parahaemolyticus]|uniref:hypothetical protein n=1 Tax=Vibrio parahaemolyticus TaxID=670 RepID=UPI0010F352EC|nr:hypothetical protein [Vibrio parahaemolyticus]ELA9326014.1 hypothetical protein [Vibrio parahaemolyticus]ELB2245013.1 hypothetical protein [Vibrio parahaemolyticus]MEA5231056.1 hypothetical protein [Vibrio parahaemolyticus]TBT53665.1 hypothetical protein D5E76_24750 [Vibrio parahaemolyticus]TOF46209.1 hypothetical protein CGJ22_23755 [Vibrio parahaemolyticus]